MKRIFLPLLILLAILPLIKVNAQDVLIVGEKSYSATSTWQFKNNASSGVVPDSPSICVAKNGEEGILFIEVKSWNPSDEIVSPCILYLLDNSVITCSTIIGRDKVDQKTSAMFKITKADIAKLTSNQISTIRYTLQTPSGIPNWENEKYAYTASCPSTINTAEDIGKLFEVQKTTNQQYLDLIKYADSLFNAGNFQLAKQKYRSISVLYPNEPYPLAKIRECDDKLSVATKSDTAIAPVQGGDDYHKEIARTFPQGVTVIKDSSNGTITEKRTVVIGDLGYIYTKKTYSWGTFYFKDGKQISEATFNYETSLAYIEKQR